MAAVTAAALGLTAASAASAEGPPLPDVQIVSPAFDDPGPLRGPFILTVSVALGGSASIILRPSVSYGVNDVPVAAQTVTAEQCLQLCTISFEVDPTTWDSPLPSGWASLGVNWYSAEGSSGTYRGISYVAPVDNVWVSGFERDDTTAARGYHPGVMDTGGSLVISGNGERIPGEVLEARVYPGPSYDPLPASVLSATGVWDPATQPAVSRIRLETATLPEGTYRLLVRARNAAGRYGFGFNSTLTVRHRPIVQIDALSAFLLRGTPLAVVVSVNRPLPAGVIPGSVQVSVDGWPAQTLPVAYWDNLNGTTGPIQGNVAVPAADLPDGVRTVTSQVLDTRGQPLGDPATGQVKVVSFTETALVPTLVVGTSVQVLFRGSAPSGMSYSSCTFGTSERSFVTNSGNLCARGDTSYSRSVPWTPWVAGAGEVQFYMSTLQGVDGPFARIPVTIYARRTASVSAVTSSAYGTRPVATITVRDLRNLMSSTVAASGVSVLLQRKAAGTSTWLTVGAGRTGSTGRALIAFTNTVSGRLRAVVASSVPGKSVVTTERTVTCVSTVSWSSLPTSTRSGALVYASVVARPSERGASVRVQARYLGSSSWTTLGSASVSSIGAARAGFRLYARRTWEVRVVRVATTLRATGYSTVRRVAVR
ncbi:MAG TPA: hypothetical protein VIL87_00845 [Dermatophilaceae bacterium]|jgi:hypothetical protein